MGSQKASFFIVISLTEYRLAVHSLLPHWLESQYYCNSACTRMLLTSLNFSIAASLSFQFALARAFTESGPSISAAFSSTTSSYDFIKINWPPAQSYRHTFIGFKLKPDKSYLIENGRRSMKISHVQWPCIKKPKRPGKITKLWHCKCYTVFAPHLHLAVISLLNHKLAGRRILDLLIECFQ